MPSWYHNVLPDLYFIFASTGNLPRLCQLADTANVRAQGLAVCLYAFQYSWAVPMTPVQVLACQHEGVHATCDAMARLSDCMHGKEKLTVQN